LAAIARHQKYGEISGRADLMHTSETARGSGAHTIFTAGNPPEGQQ
jgi:hypothetical protein